MSEGIRPEPRLTLIGESEAIRQIRQQVDRLSRSPLPTLISGETGTGKEHLARVLHTTRAGSLAGLHVLDCRAFAATSSSMAKLLSPECPHRSGPGRTVVFKNIEALSEASQAELAFRLNDPQRAWPALRDHLHVISTTTRDMGELRESGRLCADLSYSVSTITLCLPPLRYRLDDVGPLVDHFAAMMGSGEGLTNSIDALLPDLLTRPWLGNVRELRNHVFRTIQGLGEAPVDRRGERRSLHERIAAFERLLLTAKLEEFRGNIAQVGDELVMPKTTLYERLNRYALDPARFRAVRPRRGASLALAGSAYGGG